MSPFLSHGQHISLNILSLVPLVGALFHSGVSNLYLNFFFELMVVTFGSCGCPEGQMPQNTKYCWSC